MVLTSVTGLYWTHLLKRRWLGVAGAHSTQFLQSLVTQDLRVFQKPAGPTAVPALFLTPSGKVACETFIVHVPKSAEWLQSYAYLIDHSFTQTPHLLAMLQKRKLRTDVQFDLLTENDCLGFQVFPERPILPEAYARADNAQEAVDALSFWDPRAPLRLGCRIIARRSCADLLEGPLDALKQRLPVLRAMQPVSVPVQDSNAFERLRLSYGIIEDHDLVNTLCDRHASQPPAADGTVQDFESCYTLTQLNYDWFGYLARNKGCYIGQELVAKLFSTSVVRRRSLIIRALNGLDLPRTKGSLCVVLNALDEQPERGTELVRIKSQKVPVGTIAGVMGSYAIVALNTRTCRKAASDLRKHVSFYQTVPDPPESILEFEQFFRFVEWIEALAKTGKGSLAVCTDVEQMGVECVGWKLPPDPLPSLHSSLG